MFFTSINLFSQTNLKRDSFFLPHKAFPTNYKAIVGDPKGWRVIGHYNVYTEKVDLKFSSWDTLSVYTPFKDKTMFAKIRGHKIVGRGDKRVVYKIIYVDETTLILQYKQTEKIHKKNRQVIIRTLYRRRT